MQNLNCSQLHKPTVLVYGHTRIGWNMKREWYKSITFRNQPCYLSRPRWMEWKTNTVHRCVQNQKYWSRCTLVGYEMGTVLALGNTPVYCR
jgi:hypothetical protein